MDATDQLLDAACAIAHRGIFVRLTPPHRRGWAPSLSVRSSERVLAILRDLDRPELFAVVDEKARLLLGDKLPQTAMVELIAQELARAKGARKDAL